MDQLNILSFYMFRCITTPATTMPRISQLRFTKWFSLWYFLCIPFQLYSCSVWDQVLGGYFNATAKGKIVQAKKRMMKKKTHKPSHRYFFAPAACAVASKQFSSRLGIFFFVRYAQSCHWFNSFDWFIENSARLLDSFVGQPEMKLHMFDYVFIYKHIGSFGTFERMHTHIDARSRTQWNRTKTTTDTKRAKEWGKKRTQQKNAIIYLLMSTVCNFHNNNAVNVCDLNTIASNANTLLLVNDLVQLIRI